VVPVQAGSHGRDEVEEVGPVAAVPLHDVELGPEQLLRGYRPNAFSGRFELAAAGEPAFIHLRALVRHRPNGVHDDVVGEGAIDPAPVVSELPVVVAQARFGQGRYHGIAVSRKDVKIEVFGIAPGSGVGAQSEGAAHGKGDTASARRPDHAAINLFLPG
jgi:hypothetical protein